MLSKNQYNLIVDILKHAGSTGSNDEFLKATVDVFYEYLSPVSVSIYKLVQEEKLVLLREKGENFDELVLKIYNFSLMARKSIKKKNVMFLPTSKSFQNEDIDISVILIPMTHADESLGMACVVFPLGDREYHEKNRNFYTILSRMLGIVGSLKKQASVADMLDPGIAEAEFSDKISSLSVLSAGVAHEFNNILAVIKGYAELILMNDSVDSTVKDAIKVIDKQTERGSSLIERLGIFLKGKDVTFTYYPLNDIVREVLDIQRHTLENESIKVKTNLGKTPDVLVEQKQIKEALINLLSGSRQSIRARKNGGNIIIETSFTMDAVVLKVIDDGVPLDQKHIEMVQSTDNSDVNDSTLVDIKSSGSSAGLGLAIAFGIIESHGGSLQVKRRGEEGNEVKIYFTKIRPGEDPGFKNEEQEMLYLGDARLLIVDDEEPIREFLSSALERMGYQVITVADGQEAVEICTFEDIDIIFLDYLMPGFRGDKVFKKIKEVSPNTDVVFITGVDSIPHIEELLSEGLVGVLKKPFKIEKIIQITNELIYKRINYPETM